MGVKKYLRYKDKLYILIDDAEDFANDEQRIAAAINLISPFLGDALYNAIGESMQTGIFYDHPAEKDTVKKVAQDFERKINREIFGK